MFRLLLRPSDCFDSEGRFHGMTFSDWDADTLRDALPSMVDCGFIRKADEPGYYLVTPEGWAWVGALQEHSRYMWLAGYRSRDDAEEAEVHALYTKMVSLYGQAPREIRPRRGG